MFVVVLLRAAALSAQDPAIKPPLVTVCFGSLVRESLCPPPCVCLLGFLFFISIVSCNLGLGGAVALIKGFYVRII